MNEQQIELISELAQKLGTTSEFLWAILIKQAYVFGVQSIIVFVAWAIFTFIAFRFVQKLRNGEESTFDIEDNVGAIFIVVITCTIYAIFTLMVICNLFDTIICFWNPEYWALKQILDAIGK